MTPEEKNTSISEENQHSNTKSLEERLLDNIIESMKYASTKTELNRLSSAASSLLNGVDDPAAKFKMNSEFQTNKKRATRRVLTYTRMPRMQAMYSGGRNSLSRDSFAMDPIFSTASGVFQIGMAALGTMAALEKVQNSEKGNNLMDSELGETLRRIKETEEKEIHRESSKSRVEGLQNLGNYLANENLTKQDRESLIEDASRFKINISRSEDGRLELDEKSKKTLDKVANLDMNEVESKRHERKERDKEDSLDIALEGGSLNSLFGEIDDDDLPEKETGSVKVSQHKEKTVEKDQQFDKKTRKFVANMKSNFRDSMAAMPAKKPEPVTTQTQDKEESRGGGRGM